MDEDLSAWVDEELDAGAAERVYARLGTDEDLARRWETYHLIGDVLRGTGAGGIDRARFAQQLAGEPTVIAPALAARRGPAQIRSRGRLASVAAGVAAVGFVGWMAAPLFQSPPATPAPLAQTPPPVQPVATAPAVPELVPPPAAVADYLLAHNRWSQPFAGGMPVVRIVAEPAKGPRQ